MANEPQTGDDFLISDYEYFQKAFELWANHFMGVFYLWTGVIVVPATAATLLPQLGFAQNHQSWMLGVVFIGVALVGWFISRKMFDIRKAQLNYIKQMNLIREKAYTVLGIEARFGLTPFGKGADVKKTSGEDYGKEMGRVMSMFHGAYLAVGVGAVVLHFFPNPLVWITAGAMFGLLLFFRNDRDYVKMVTDKL